jgi:hypothetical protein
MIHCDTPHDKFYSAKKLTGSLSALLVIKNPSKCAKMRCFEPPKHQKSAFLTLFFHRKCPKNRLLYLKHAEKPVYFSISEAKNQANYGKLSQSETVLRR